MSEAVKPLAHGRVKMCSVNIHTSHVQSLDFWIVKLLHLFADATLLLYPGQSVGSCGRLIIMMWVFC